MLLNSAVTPTMPVTLGVTTSGRVKVAALAMLGRVQVVMSPVLLHVTPDKVALPKVRLLERYRFKVRPAVLASGPVLVMAML